MIGQTIAHYKVTAKLGAGGMGEVYRATDTKLGREVALKVLPPAFAQDEQRMARFQREAQVLASLNHPNIAAIYGLEEAGGVRALVMELVPGAPIRGPLPVETAFDYAKQIADALEAAHEKGIIHRDLKPANIMVTPQGVAKVLDFGLAAVTQASAENSGDISNSPTLTNPGTHAGMIMGTAAYMSPEQAAGKPVDRRADIWSFGAVIWEMLTGKRLFEGETVSHTLAAVLTKTPDLQQVPRKARRLLQSCLQKDVKQRLQAIGDWRLLVEESPEEAAPAATSRLPWALVAALALITIVSLVVMQSNRSPAGQQATTRLTIPLPPGHEVTTYPAITPDGRTVAYVTQQGTDDSQLYLRDLNSFEARAVSGARGAKQPFFSPDGKWVAFFAGGQLQKAEVAGGAPVRLAEAPYAFGGTWNEDNTIIYAASLGSGLLRIPASGGTPESLTKPDGAANGYAHVFPQALPGGRSVLFSIWGQPQGGALLSLDSGRWETILSQTGFAVAFFEATSGSAGRLLLMDQAAGIRAAPFDVARPGRTSADASVLTNVYTDVEAENRGWLAVSNTGTAVYASGDITKTTLAWVDRNGKVESLGSNAEAYREVNLSPDGTKAVVRQHLELWVHDLQRGTRSRIATPANSATNLVRWNHDGTRVVFASNRGGDWDIYSQPADASQPAEVLLKRPSDQFPLQLLADGTLLFLEIQSATGRDLWIRKPDGEPSPLRVTPFNEVQAQFSPSPAGSPRWVAYASDESGRSEIYVQSYPGGGNRVPVSTGGGILPRWSRDGKELFYVAGDAMMVVAMQPDGSFGGPRRLFDRSNFFFNHRFNSYSVSPDGQRFLLIRRDPGSVPRQLNVILNWSAERDRPPAENK